MYFQVFKSGFCVICTVATIALCTFWIYKYSLNEDITHVEYHMFYETPSDPYPIASLCFRNYFYKERFSQLKINASSYVNYLSGNHIMAEYSNIDYDNLTMKIGQYIVKHYHVWKNGSRSVHTIDEPQKLTYQTSYSGFIWSDTFYKCFAVEMPRNNEFQVFSLLVQNGIFPNGFRPANYDFIVLIHYPNQLLRSMDTIRYTWIPRDKKKEQSYEMIFTINSMDVQEYRYKHNRPCNMDWQIHDNVLLGEHLTAVGCRTPYQTSKKEFPICDSKSKMKAAQFDLSPNKVTDN